MRNQNAASSEQQSADGIVSHMLMGFVERKISPQTIADVLRAQIIESQVEPYLLNGVTCNGILEAITHANATEDCADLILFICSHPEFPDFLSFRASAGGLCILVNYFKRSIETQPEVVHTHIENALEALSNKLLTLLHSKRSVNSEDKDWLVQILKTLAPSVTRAMRSQKNFQQLRFSLMAPHQELSEFYDINHALPSAYEMLRNILQESDDTLKKNGVSFYRTDSAGCNASGKIKIIDAAFDVLKTETASDFRLSFVSEWLFERGLIEAVINDDTTFDYISAIRKVFTQYHHQLAIVRGLLLAIQKDFAALAAHPLQMNYEYHNDFMNKANRIAQHIFLPITEAAEKDPHFITKNIANWTMDLPAQNEDLKFFKRIHWRWVRTLSMRIWDASLREPPYWVIEGASIYCATIFQGAPALWLQEHSWSLLEKLHSETIGPHFEPTSQHYDYIEFLARCLRKKSPFFASRTESLYAISLLKRLTKAETTQYQSAQTRFQAHLINFSLNYLDISTEFSLWKNIILNPKFEDQLGNNPVTRALVILFRLAQETAKK